MAPHNILFIFGALGGGGTQRQFSTLIRHMDRTLWEPHLCTIGTDEASAELHLRNYPRESDLAIADESVRWSEISKYYLYRQLKDALPIHFIPREQRTDILGPFMRSFQLIRAVQPEIVFCVTPLAGYYGRPAARLAGIRVIIQGVRGTPSSDRTNRFRNLLLSLLDRALVPVTTRYIGNSKAVVASLADRGFPRSKLNVVYNGIEAAAVDDTGSGGFKPDPAKTHVGMFARLYPMKDHGTFLKAITLVPDTIPVQFHIFGNGPEEPSLKSRVNEMGISSQVMFHGWIPDARLMIPRMDIVALCSRDGEGFNNSIAEAQMAGKPVVTTDAPGCREVVRDTHTGFVVPVQSPGKMADCLTRLVTDPALRKSMGEHARKHAEKTYSIKTMIHAYETIFREETAGKGGD